MYVCYQNWKYFQLVHLLIRSVWKKFWAKLPVCRKTDEKETFVCLPSSIILTLPTLFRLLFAEIFIQSSILFQNLLVQTENPPILLGTTKKGLVESPLPLACFLQWCILCWIVSKDNCEILLWMSVRVSTCVADHESLLKQWRYM